MNNEKQNPIHNKVIQYAPFIGILLVISGLFFILDQRFQSIWFTISIPAVISIMLVVYGFLKKKIWLSVAGLMLTGLGFGLFALLIPVSGWEIKARIGVALLIQGVFWATIFIVLLVCKKVRGWWALIVAFIALALAYQFLSGRHSILDYVFFNLLAIGIVFLLWGIVERKIGFIIPGALCITMGSGLYNGWGNPETPGGLQKTGIMLVWFALGWILITVISKIIDKRFLWWPLIPGGILLMVGSGLYIGGSPENALGFIGNTGSVGLIVIGVYLIFLKYGMKK